jgi:uncharacterized membrane protein YhaH (DUF805 family)
MTEYLEVLKKYAVFSGRARRKEYWMYFLFNIIIGICIAIVDAVVHVGFLQLIYSLALLIPSLAVAVRRLHDTGKSGWWLLIGLVPFAGVIILIVLFCLDSEPGTNAYGPNPKGVSGPAVAAV